MSWAYCLHGIKIYLFNKFELLQFSFHWDQYERWIGARGVRIREWLTYCNKSHHRFKYLIFMLNLILFRFIEIPKPLHLLMIQRGGWFSLIFDEITTIFTQFLFTYSSTRIYHFVYDSFGYQFMESKSHKWLIQNNCSAFFRLLWKRTITHELITHISFSFGVEANVWLISCARNFWSFMLINNKISQFDEYFKSHFNELVDVTHLPDL